MRQPTPTLPITTKMLRHFAIVTVAITACIGVFAQGENAKVDPKPKQVAAVPEESGGGFLDFGGAERRALAGGHKESREVNGMKLASGTRLESGGGSDLGETPEHVADGVGYIQNTQPAMGTRTGSYAAGAPAATDFASPAAPPPIPKDANGVPAPGAAISAGNPANAGKPQPPRKATQQDIDQMMAASIRRSGGAATD